MNIIPAIDLKGGQCVRLLKGDFEQETRYGDDPLLFARQFVAMGFRHLHVVDLDGARDGQQANRKLLRTLIAESGLSVQLGGGIRDRDGVARWLDEGVRQVVIGSLAVTSPDVVIPWMREFGPEQFVLALDCEYVNGTPWLTTHGWTRRSQVSLWDGVENYLDAGVCQVLCTDVSRDGAMTGPSIDLYREFLERFPTVGLQASGGVRNLSDLLELRQIGASGAITGRAMLDGKICAEEIESFQQSA